jgi:multiple sugar transport system permease protein
MDCVYYRVQPQYVDYKIFSAKGLNVMRKRFQIKKIFNISAVQAGLIITAIFFSFPMFWVFMTSFKAPLEYYRMPPKIFPSGIPIIHYQEAFAPWTIDIEVGSAEEKKERWFAEEVSGRAEPVTPQIINSLIITAGSIILSLLVGTPAAYALSRFRFAGSKDMSLWVLSTRMMPPIVMAIPIFWLLRSINLLGTHLGLIFVYVMVNLPFVVWMMKGFFDGIPKEIEESALIDGAGHLQAFFRVVLPLALPGIVATALFGVFLTWNEFLFAVILTDRDCQTLPVALSSFRQERGILWGQMSATIVVATLPILFITLFLQKHIVKGLTAGAIK